MQSRPRAWPLVRRPVGLLRLGAGWLLALLLLAGAGAPAAPAASAGGAPKLRPLPAELERRMPELGRAAGRYRRLELARPAGGGPAAPPPRRPAGAAAFPGGRPPAAP